MTALSLSKLLFLNSPLLIIDSYTFPHSALVLLEKQTLAACVFA